MSGTPAGTGQIPWRRELQALFSLREGPWRWSVGAQVGLALGIPLAIFTLAGHQSEGLIASLGAFTAIYKASLRRIDRLRALPLIGLVFAVAAGVGVLASVHPWLVVGALIMVTIVATLAALRLSLGPPGPMMFTLVTGVAAHLSTPPERGRPGFDRLSIPLYVAIGEAGAVVVIVAPLLLPSIREREGAPASFGSLFPTDQLDREYAEIFIRVGSAVVIASLLARFWEVGHGYWLVMVAGVLLQSTHSARVTLVRAVHRMLGTLLGVGAFALVLRLEPDGLSLVLVMALLQGLTEVVIVRNYGLGLIFVTPLALIIATRNRTGDVTPIVTERIVDTLLGALIALVVLYGSMWVMGRYWPVEGDRVSG
jgi:hypothetical protein